MVKVEKPKAKTTTKKTVVKKVVAAKEKKVPILSSSSSFLPLPFSKCIDIKLNVVILDGTSQESDRSEKGRHQESLNLFSSPFLFPSFLISQRYSNYPSMIH